MKSDNIILISGAGRSGTTLLAMMLDSHSEISMGPELHFRSAPDMGRYLLHCIRVKKEDDAAYKTDPGVKPGRMLIARIHRMGIDENELTELIIKTGVHQSGGFSFKDRCKLVYACMDHQRQRVGKKYMGIKIMNDDPRMYKEQWPGCKIIHIVRDPRDVAASQFSKGWGFATPADAARGWVNTLELNMELALTVKYEDLVKKDGETISDLCCDFIGVYPQVGMLAHHKQDHPFFDNHYNHPSINQVKQPVNNSAVGRYKTDLSPEQIKIIEMNTMPYIEELGYV